MSKRGKRGVSKCKKKSNDPDKSTIEFNENGLAIGENAALFKSCLGLEFRKRIPYYKLVKDIDKKLYNDLWEHMKVLYFFFLILKILYLLLFMINFFFFFESVGVVEHT